jgi:hypothetical protein
MMAEKGGVIRLIANVRDEQIELPAFVCARFRILIKVRLDSSHHTTVRHNTVAARILRWGWESKQTSGHVCSLLMVSRRPPKTEDGRRQAIYHIQESGVTARHEALCRTGHFYYILFCSVPIHGSGFPSAPHPSSTSLM